MPPQLWRVIFDQYKERLGRAIPDLVINDDDYFHNFLVLLHTALFLSSYLS